MRNRQVRAVVSTKFGCQERTDWFPEGSPEATKAMQNLVHQQTEIVCVDWENEEEEE